MSNTPTNARQTGSSRRRGSRGGRGRQRGQGGGTRTKERNESAGESGLAPRRQRTRKPQLTWWQKLLKAIGLYREPKPVRKPRAEAVAPIKSNTRGTRTKEASGTKTGGGAPRGGDVTSVKSGRLYVGNLSYDASEHDLQELFKGIATVRSVEIVYNRNTHRSKGYGFVEMLNREDALRAVEVLHDQPFMGRKMIVSGADSKGRDSREDRDATSSDEGRRAVVVAPVPAAKAAATVVTDEQTVIPTVVETTGEAAAVETAAAPAPVQLELGAAEAADERERTAAS